MSKLIIHGGKPLAGQMRINGMKNAATKLIAACLLTHEECVLRNVPRVIDVLKMIELVQSLGADIIWEDPHTLRVRCNNISLKDLDKSKVKSMRSSIALLGPLLARFLDVTLPEPGGDNIGKRPLDTNLFALRALGATIEQTSEGYRLSASEIKPTTIILPEFSVGATENALMAAARTVGDTIIKLAAVEPSVQELSSFLNKMGAEVKEIGTHIIKISGNQKLHGAEHIIAPDNLEIGTFAVAAAATCGSLELSPVVPFHIETVVEKLKAIGVRLEFGNNYLKILPGGELKNFKLQTMPFPGFPTDLQAPFGVLGTQCQGTTLIHDPLFEGRMVYVNELIKMGADAVICDPHRVLITGSTPLRGREVPSLDIRSGATLVLAGLVASGETVIHDIEILERGYENLEGRLSEVGAEVVRV